MSEYFLFYSNIHLLPKVQMIAYLYSKLFYSNKVDNTNASQSTASRIKSQMQVSTFCIISYTWYVEKGDIVQ